MHFLWLPGEFPGGRDARGSTRDADLLWSTGWALPAASGRKVLSLPRARLWKEAFL